MCICVWVRIPKTLQSVGNECPERSLLHLTDPVIAFPPLHLSSSARPVMLAELNWAEVDREGCSRTARQRRWRRVCLDVAEVSVHCLGRWDEGEDGERREERTVGAGRRGQRCGCYFKLWPPARRHHHKANKQQLHFHEKIICFF